MSKNEDVRDKEEYTTTQCEGTTERCQNFHIQHSSSSPLLLCLSRERLNPFDCTVKLLIWNVTRQPFNIEHQVPGFTNQAQVGKDLGISVNDKCLEPVKRLFGKQYHLYQVRQFFDGPFACACYPTTLFFRNI